jgi:hypothetical protein
MTTTNAYDQGYIDGYDGNDMAHQDGATAAAYHAGYQDGAEQYVIDSEDEDYPDEYNDDDGLTDAEADAMTLAGAGWGTDEDYGYYGENDFDY